MTATWLRPLPLCIVLALSTGCAALTRTPSGFVRLEDAGWDYRATSAEGVVVTVRHLRHDPRGELGFWTDSVENEMKRRGGYVLERRASVKTQGGAKGTLLRFRHREGEDAHLYYVAVFLDDDRLSRNDLFIVEAGGKAPAVQHAEPAILSAIENLRVD